MICPKCKKEKTDSIAIACIVVLGNCDECERGKNE